MIDPSSMLLLYYSGNVHHILSLQLLQSLQYKFLKKVIKIAAAAITTNELCMFVNLKPHLLCSQIIYTDFHNHVLTRNHKHMSIFQVAYFLKFENHDRTLRPVTYD
jgi:hypothetical protein